jgi:hypothetical protein
MATLEQAIIRELEPVTCKEEHLYAEGTYTRVLHIPKDAVLTGKVHRESCINILSKGSMLVVTDEGEYTITAPYHFVSGPGVKKAGYALEDSIWINVHPWDGEEDLMQIEHKTIISDEELERLEDTQ